MDNIIISLGSRYAAAFGLLASTKQPNAVSVSQYGFKYYGAHESDFEDISFKWNNPYLGPKEVYFGKLPFNSGDEYLGSILAPPPLISFSQSKKLVETPINGNDNVVVERWGTTQWEMSLKGLLIDVHERQYPSELIKRLYNLFRYDGVIESIGKQFFEKRIKFVYFIDIDIQGVQGFPDTVQFSLVAKSINPVNFTLLNPNQ